MDIASKVAFLVVRCPKWIIAGALAIIIGCVLILQSQQRFDSEVLNLLPNVESVEALKNFNDGFTQARELTFALRGEAETVAAFEEHFIRQLREEPWVVRVFSGSPMENPEELEVLQKMVPPLLLNLDQKSFKEALPLLDPSAIRERFTRLRSEIEAGSPKAEMILSTDPLGLLGKAFEPIAGIYNVKGEGVLASADGTLRVVPVMTNQETLSQPDCKALMEGVEDFKKRVIASWEGKAPEILVTGRSAYVAEISTSMKRDVQVTSMISILAVSGLFYFGFRRLFPLLGIVTILSLSCFISFAIGCLVFDNLNMIAIAFCSILVGLGDDFSLLLYNRYLQARGHAEGHEQAIATSIRDVGRGIFFVALTTGVGFMALLFSDSNGFAQLGILIAIGIVTCAILMIVLLFLFIRPGQIPAPVDPVHTMVGHYLSGAERRPFLLGIPMTALLLGVVAFAIAPFKPLSFDTDPRSLEPKQSQAAFALRTITENVPAVSEPVVVLMENNDPQQAYEHWNRLAEHLRRMQEAGRLKDFSTPAALMLSPRRVQENQKLLGGVDFKASREALEQTLGELGFNAESFASVFKLMDALESSVSKGVEVMEFRKILPPESSWWFILDRYLSPNSDIAAAYLKTSQSLTSSGAQAELEQQIREAGVPLKVTGWKYAMTSLVPWAKKELILFSFGVGGLILIVLGIAYRQWTAWFIHAASLVFALAATITCLKLFGHKLNLLNALAFPLIIGVGVDYGIHVLFALKERNGSHNTLPTVLKPLIICGLTTICGFGSLMFAKNPALSGMGTVCAIGIFWCLVSSVLFIIPVYFLFKQKDNS